MTPEEKAKDWRIGNFVTIDNPKYHYLNIGKTHVVNEIRQDSLNLYVSNTEENYGQLYKFIKPIPLKEEWLLKFGFTKKLDLGALNYFTYYKDNLSITEHHNIFELDESFVVEIKHVHQLQNLYYVLTNTELTIKE